MSISCEIAAPFVANSAVDGEPVTRLFRSHAGRCLKCQARHAAMTRTARHLAAMRDETTPAPADVEWRVMSSLEGELAIARTIRRPVAWIAAALSMAAAVLIWRMRPRAF